MDMEHFDLEMVINRMQDAVDIVLSSEHETSKVAACLFHPDGNPSRIISRTNHRPSVFKEHFKMSERIGKSSQFVHAEAACVLEYPKSAVDHYLCVTDPFCPNCAKTIVENGIQRVFIDHKGMEKDFVKRRAGAFNLISLRMAEEAGIEVYILYRKERRFEPLCFPKTKPKQKDDGVLFEELDANVKAQAPQDILKQFIQTYDVPEIKEPMAMAILSDAEGRSYLVMTKERVGKGLHSQEVAGVSPEDTDKYRFEIDPVNKLYFVMKSRGLSLEGQTIFCNHYPSSRALVNGMLTDVKSFIMKDIIEGHDPLARESASLLQSKSIIDFEML